MYNTLVFPWPETRKIIELAVTAARLSAPAKMSTYPVPLGSNIDEPILFNTVLIEKNGCIQNNPCLGPRNPARMSTTALPWPKTKRRKSGEEKIVQRDGIVTKRYLLDQSVRYAKEKVAIGWTVKQM